MRISLLSTRYIIGEEILINGLRYTEFTDGNCVLLRYSKDLSSSVPFDEFIHSEPQLFPLRFNSNDGPKRITSVNVGDTFFLDLRYFEYSWYNSLDLLDAYVTTHVVACG